MRAKERKNLRFPTLRLYICYTNCSPSASLTTILLQGAFCPTSVGPISRPAAKRRGVHGPSALPSEVRLPQDAVTLIAALPLAGTRQVARSRIGPAGLRLV